MIRFCISVDVEEDLPGLVPLSVRGIREGLPSLIDVLEEFNLKADFFFLSRVALASPDLVREIASKGHGIGNHGMDHSFLCTKSASLQRSDVVESKRVLEQVSSQPIRMFRAPNFSSDTNTMRILQEAGYGIDSSVLPGRYARRSIFHKVYDHRGMPQEPYFPLHHDSPSKSSTLLEIPVTANPLRRGSPLGLGALNFYGASEILQIMRAGRVDLVVFLIHPWELLNLKSEYPSLPDGYAKACSDDTQVLREFLEMLKGTVQFHTFGELEESLRRGARQT